MSRLSWIAAGCFLAGMLMGGCPLAAPVAVDVFNETNFDVDPFIYYDDASGFFDGDFLLNTGILEPGDVISYEFDCEELVFIQSDEAEQYVFGETFIADATFVVEQGIDFECGDLIEFVFVGDDFDFEALVFVNGELLN